MKWPQHFLGVDIGTTKICALIARADDPDSPLEILGVGLHPSFGLNRGSVVDMEVTANSIQEACRKAMNLAGVEVRRAVVGIAGNFIRSFNSIGSTAVSGPERGITPADVRRATLAASSKVIPKDYDVIHELHRTYRVDDSDGILEPVGMSGSLLKVDVHLVAGQRTALRNIRSCTQQGGILTGEIVLQPIASGLSILTEEEKEAGVALVDIGGGTTDVAVFTEGHIRHSEVILIGGDYITKDICRAFVTPFESGESLKQRYGMADCSKADPDETIEIVRIAGRKPVSVRRQELAWVIEARIEQILDQVRRSLEENNLHNRIFGGIVLTGGVALLEGLREKTEEYLGMETQIGYPSNITGCKNIITSPMYATAVGLLHYGRWKMCDPALGPQSWMKRKLNHAFERLGAMI